MNLQTTSGTAIAILELSIYATNNNAHVISIILHIANDNITNTNNNNIMYYLFGNY